MQKKKKKSTRRVFAVDFDTMIYIRVLPALIYNPYIIILKNNIEFQHNNSVALNIKFTKDTSVYKYNCKQNIDAALERLAAIILAYSRTF